jgi:hypothetical protein
MQVIFHSRDPEGNEMRNLAVERVRFVMRRMSWLVPHAKVQLEDINGPHGGVDKRCQLEFKTHTSGTVVVTAIASSWSDALNGALARAARALVRGWQRNRAHPRLRQSAVGFDG